MDEQNLLIRRLYRKNSVNVVVEIDLVDKKLSLVEYYNGTWRPKKWVFADRETKYLMGWQMIVDAMQHAITEAMKVLEIAEQRDEARFAELLLASTDSVESLVKGNKKDGNEQNG